MEKTLGNTDISGTEKNVPDVVKFGNGDAWQLLCKVYSKAEGWMKSTKAYEIPNVGCIVQTTTQQAFWQGYPSGVHGSVATEKQYAITDSLVFVPDVRIVEDHENGGRKLISNGGRR